MLSEDTHVRQIEGEPKRRWFSDYYFDLIVWLESQESGLVPKIPSINRAEGRESHMVRKIRSIYGTEGQEEKPDRIIGFQLCYDKPGHERALTWTEAAGYTHHHVDTGEAGPKSKRTPLLVADSEFEQMKIAELFREDSVQIDQRIAQLVYEKVSQYQPSIGPDKSHSY